MSLSILDLLKIFFRSQIRNFLPFSLTKILSEMFVTNLLLTLNFLESRFQNTISIKLKTEINQPIKLGSDVFTFVELNSHKSFYLQCKASLRMCVTEASDFILCKFHIRLIKLLLRKLVLNSSRNTSLFVYFSTRCFT